MPANSTDIQFNSFDLSDRKLDHQKLGPFNLLDRIASLSKQTSEEILDLTPHDLDLQFGIRIYTKGANELVVQNDGLDHWFWLLDLDENIGSSFAEIIVKNELYKLSRFDSLYVGSEQFDDIRITVARGYLLKISQDPKLAK